MTIPTLPPAAPAPAEPHAARMHPAAPGDTASATVFAPALLRIAPGDSVTVAGGCDSRSSDGKRGMIPDGAEPWNGGIDEDLTVTPTAPGVYGYV